VEITPAGGNASARSVSVKNIPIIGVAIVEEIAQLLRYGLKWANLSCSFDTVCTILICLYSVFSTEQKSHLQTAWGTFGDILAHTDMRSKASVADTKRKMMEIFIRNPLDPVFVTGVMYSIETVYQVILAPHFLKTKDEGDFMRIKYEITKECPLGCHQYSQEYKKRELDLFSSVKLRTDLDDASVKVLIKNFWARRNHTCTLCNSLMTPIRNFIRAPAILAVSVNGMVTKIDQILNYEGAAYSVFSVAYRGEGHFIALIKLDDIVYEYDGMVNDGLLRQVASDEYVFNNVYRDTSRRIMKAQIVWYTQYTKVA
jgi:hypothetical protein